MMVSRVEFFVELLHIDKEKDVGALCDASCLSQEISRQEGSWCGWSSAGPGQEASSTILSCPTAEAAAALTIISPKTQK